MIIFIISLLLFLILLLEPIIMRPKSRLPPGPQKLPFIGNMNHLAGEAPHRSLRDLAIKYGPVMHLKLGFISTIIVSSAEAAKQFLKIHDHVFVNRPNLVAPKVFSYNYTDIAFAPYGAYWRQLRKICILELLTNKRVDSFGFVREEEVLVLLRAIAEGSPKPVNLVEKLFSTNHSIITKIAFGKKFELDHQQEFKMAMKEGTVLMVGFHVGDYVPCLGFIGSLLSGMKSRLEKNFTELDRIMSRIIQERVDQKRNVSMPLPEEEDHHQEYLIDILLQIKDSGGLEVPLTIDNIKSILLDIFTGTTENSSNTVEWAMTEMMRNPRIMQKAQAEVRAALSGKKKANTTTTTVEESDLHKLKYVKMVIKETLRVHPPSPILIPRESVEKCTINGYEIPEKARVVINYYAISRDPLVWENPETFEPERFERAKVDFRGQNFEFIPFGAGRRVCPGISFGVANIELPLAALLYHFDWNLPHGMKSEDVEMNETVGITLFKTNSLHLIPTLRFPIPNN